MTGHRVDVPDRGRSYKDLIVWRQGIRLTKDCYLLTGDFPREEMYGLTSQIRRAATSIPANIAEGSARGTPKDFVNFLRVAQGSLRELETHLIVSAEVGLKKQQRTLPVIQQIESISYLLQRLIASQTSVIREDREEYYAGTPYESGEVNHASQTS